MGKPVHSLDEYAADPWQVFAMVTDETFIRAKYEALDATDIEIRELGATSSGGFRTVTQRSIEPSNIPEIAKKIFGGRQTVVQTEEWGPPADDGSRSGTWQVQTKGTPASVGGTATLRPDGTGSILDIVGELKVSVPLIGGRIESASLPAIEDEMRKEREFGQQWLADH